MEVGFEGWVEALTYPMANFSILPTILLIFSTGGGLSRWGGGGEGQRWPLGEPSLSPPIPHIQAYLALVGWHRWADGVREWHPLGDTHWDDTVPGSWFPHPLGVWESRWSISTKMCEKWGFSKRPWILKVKKTQNSWGHMFPMSPNVQTLCLGHYTPVGLYTCWGPSLPMYEEGQAKISPTRRNQSGSGPGSIGTDNVEAKDK